MVEQLFKVKQVASKLGVTESTVRKWLYEDKLKRTKLGRATRISQSQLDEFIKKGMQCRTRNCRV